MALTKRARLVFWVGRRKGIAVLIASRMRSYLGTWRNLLFWRMVVWQLHPIRGGFAPSINLVGMRQNPCGDRCVGYDAPLVISPVLHSPRIRSTVLSSVAAHL